jgi:hypothetical protein
LVYPVRLVIFTVILAIGEEAGFVLGVLEALVVILVIVGFLLV